VRALGSVAAVGVATADIGENLQIETKISAVAAPKATTAPYGRTDRLIYL
jgi:hypothetical protein